MFFPQAYKKLVEKEGTDGALPGLGLTEEQLFFVGFARVGIIEKINPHKHFF